MFRALPDRIMEVSNKIFVELGLPTNLSDQLILVALFAIILRTFTMQTVPLITAVFRRVLYIMGTVYLLRALTVTLTVLPNPLTQCESQPDNDLFYDAYLLLTMKRVSCGDVFFSGHSIIFTISTAIWTTYSRATLVNSLFTVSAFMGMFSLVASAYHYSIDVIFGYLVTMWIWNHYHWSITLPSFRATWWGRALNRLDDPMYVDDDFEDDDVGTMGGSSNSSLNADTCYTNHNGMRRQRRTEYYPLVNIASSEGSSRRPVELFRIEDD